jgi:AraC-like DNA-binding protein
MTLHLSVLDWLGTLVAGGAIVVALCVGVLLLVRQAGSRTANLALGGLLLVAALAVLYVLLLSVQPPGENLGIVFAPLAYTFSFGPLLYAYVRARLGRGRPSLAHAVLPTAQACVVLGVGLAPLGAKAWWMGNVFAPWWASAQVALTIASLGGYLLASWVALRKERAADAAGWRLRRDQWLRRLLLGVTVALVVLVAIDGVDLLTGANGVGRPMWVVGVERLAYAASLYAVALAGLVQADVRFEPGPTAGVGWDVEPLGPVAPREASLPPEQAAVYLDALARVIASERPHLDPDLSLSTLADQVGISDKTLSALFNETMGTTYTAYVNGLRVEEAKRRLVDPAQAHLSVLAVGLDAGFPSKSTFNRVFKESAGQTPSAFRADHGSGA